MYAVRMVCFLFMSIALCLYGCSSGNPLPENVLQVGNGAEVQELDPHIVSGVTEHRVLTSLFEGLLAGPYTHLTLPTIYSL